jgi:predicted Zn-dependent protease
MSSNRRRTARRLAVLAAALIVPACSTVPITGRQQLSLIPSSEMMAMSDKQYDDFLSKNPVSRSADSTKMVRDVGVRIQGAVERFMTEKGMADKLKGYAWEFNLVQNPQVNAWCMPGGKVVFYTGILPVCRDANGIAVVMGHEVAHAVADHGGERMSQAMIAEMGGTALSAALASKPQQTQALWMTAFGVGADYGVLKPFSRQQESEADRLGLVFMAMAGYDPRTAPAFWERMSAASGGAAPPEIMSTHPSDATRIKKLNEQMPEAMTYYKPN